MASLGEAALILGDFNEAKERYCAAGEAGKGHYGDLSTTRRQARKLIEFLREDPHQFDDCFIIPIVAVFSGTGNGLA